MISAKGTFDRCFGQNSYFKTTEKYDIIIQ